MYPKVDCWNELILSSLFLKGQTMRTGVYDAALNLIIINISESGNKRKSICYLCQNHLYVRPIFKVQYAADDFEKYLHKSMTNIFQVLNIIENIMAKLEIAHHEKFVL